jgi:hypothetical protein
MIGNDDDFDESEGEGEEGADPEPFYAGRLDERYAVRCSRLPEDNTALLLAFAAVWEVAVTCTVADKDTGLHWPAAVMCGVQSARIISAEKDMVLPPALPGRLLSQQ